MEPFYFELRPDQEGTTTVSRDSGAFYFQLSHDLSGYDGWIQDSGGTAYEVNGYYSSRLISRTPELKCIRAE